MNQSKSKMLKPVLAEWDKPKRKQMVKMIVRLHYSYDGQMYEMRPARGFTLEIEGVTRNEIAGIEELYAALDWSELDDLVEAARDLLILKRRIDPARHERKVKR